MSNQAQDIYDTFLNIWKDSLDGRNPIKRKHLRSNHISFMNNYISKAITNLTRLINSFLKSSSFKDKEAYNKQRSHCVSLARKTKTDYYNNLDHKKVVGNKSIWKYIKPHFTDKSLSFNKITPVKLLKHLLIY